MSRVATARRSEFEMTIASLSRRWTLKVIGGNLNDKLTLLDITDQHESPLDLMVNGITGNVWTAGSEVDVLGLMRGETHVIEEKQFVSFDIVFKGSRYSFSGGVLSPDGTQINNGKISRSPLVGTEPPTKADDGTWSAKAEPGGPGEPRKPATPPGRKKRHRR